VIGLVDRLARRFLHAVDPEQGHTLALHAFRLSPMRAGPDDARLTVEAFGLKFPNPVGIAAGFDKNAEAVDGVLRAGFGFAEAGTVTPQPQSGNPRPRLFRLTADTGVINRLGFNNQGHAAVLARLRSRSRNGIVGVNIGANKDSPDRTGDYVAGVKTFAPVASYLAVNISSPNTPGLRDLQQAQALDGLLARVLDARAALPASERRPVLLKIAPDLALADLDDIVAVARRRGIDGMIVSNTTVTRPPRLTDAQRGEQGGLSGHPLFALSTRVLAETFVRVERAFPLVGVGGIDSGASAFEKIRAGATLVQLYTGLVFHGVGLVADIKAHLVTEIARAGTSDIAPFVGADASARTAEPWPD
jgi:dihydroorotate dehydrogenase